MSDLKHWSGPYRDDRMFVMRITTGTTRTYGGSISGSSDGKKAVFLITYRNVPSLPVTGSNEFETIEDAIQYVKEVEPTCPRISLEGESPSPTPSWQEHLEWLRELGLRSAAEGYQPRPDWAIKEGRFPS